MLTNTLRYLGNLPDVVKKLVVLHRFSVFLDEATPEQLETSLRAWRLFKRDYGYLRALKEQQCVDAQGQAIPWYTYAAIEQLKRWDFSQCDVLEYGCGNSTKWWAARANSVTSIENNPAWHEKIRQQTPDNCQLLLAEVDDSSIHPEQIQTYVNVIDQLGQFDVIIVDGVNHAGVRKQCTEKALQHLKPGGLIIIDNADWLPLTCQLLRSAGFFENDYVGLGPLNAHAETTSLFHKADFRIPPASPEHPGHNLGGLTLNCDPPSL